MTDFDGEGSGGVELDDDELQVHEAFRVLREQVVKVSAEFAARVSASIKRAALLPDQPEASLWGLLGSVLVEAANMLSHAVAADSDPESDE